MAVRKTTAPRKDLIAENTCPRISIDFEAANNPIGIEILYPYEDDPPEEPDEEESN